MSETHRESLILLFSLFDTPVPDIPDYLREIESLENMFEKRNTGVIFFVITDHYRRKIIEKIDAITSRVSLHEYGIDSFDFNAFLSHCLEQNTDIICVVGRMRLNYRVQSEKEERTVPLSEWIFDKLKPLIPIRKIEALHYLVACKEGRTVMHENESGNPWLLLNVRNADELMKLDLFAYRQEIIRSRVHFDEIEEAG